MKIGSNLIQSEVIAFEAAGFSLDDRQALYVSPISGENVGRFDANPTCEPTIATLSASKVVVLESLFSSDAPFNAIRSRSILDDDKRPNTL